MELGYFNDANYTGNHLHIDNFKDQSTPYSEAIGWERQDKTLDIFFNDFFDTNEINALFANSEHYLNDFKGVFLKNVKTDEEASEFFLNWVETVLIPFRSSLLN